MVTRYHFCDQCSCRKRLSERGSFFWSDKPDYLKIVECDAQWRTNELYHSITFPNPNIKYQLILPGIKSTQGVTYHRSTGKIINHIYPDVDRTVGIELTKVKTSKYKDNHVRRWKILQKIQQTQSSEQNYWTTAQAKAKVAERYWQKSEIGLNHQQTICTCRKIS